MATATIPRDSGTSDLAGTTSTRQLVVTWQHPELREVFPIGLLSFDGTEYVFTYLKTAPDVVDFRPLLGFPAFEKRYASEDLFPLFLQRAMDPRRPDYSRYVQDLGLTQDATPWEQISRSGGARGSDTLQLFPVPRFTGDDWSCFFLVHGMRYLLEKTVVVGGIAHDQYSEAQFEEVLSSLTGGETLSVEHEVTNKRSETSLLVIAAQDHPLGWVPDWLARDVLDLHHAECLTFAVDQVNPADAGWHMRLVVQMRADCPEDYEFFAGPRWATFA